MITGYIDLKGNIENYSQLKQPAEAIRNGNLVVFPTETVYGIGANALDESAVRRIFEAKGRAADNPLIVHVSNMEMLSRVVEKVRRNRAEVNG